MAPQPAMLRTPVGSSSLESPLGFPASAVAVPHSRWQVLRVMIILLHPRASRPKNRRFPLAILSIAAVLEGKEDYVIVDGNLDPQPARTLDRIVSESKVEMLAVSVMPGPQMVSAIQLSKEFRRKYASVPIVWGGYFPSLYTDAALNR